MLRRRRCGEHRLLPPSTESLACSSEDPGPALPVGPSFSCLAWAHHHLQNKPCRGGREDARHLAEGNHNSGWPKRGLSGTCVFNRESNLFIYINF